MAAHRAQLAHGGFPAAGNVRLLRQDPDYAMTAAEHLEEVARLLDLEEGPWALTVRLRDGHVERLVADPVGGKRALGRDELHERRRELSSEQLR
jgi:hypothetical protein